MPAAGSIQQLNTMHIIMNEKQKQRQIMDKIKPFCTLSNTNIAILADVSPSLVSYVWAGIGRNETVLKTILSNLSEGWDEVVSNEEIESLF
jgi:hypothetical protein